VFIGGGFEYYVNNEFNARVLGKDVERPQLGGGCGSDRSRVCYVYRESKCRLIVKEEQRIVLME
jgi:hypothetical protein